MLERYVEAGFDPSAFWGLSLRLYQIHMAGAAARMRNEQDQAKSMAWLNAGLQRAQKMPKLEALLARKGEITDTGFRLASVKARLPKITLAEWAARKGARE